MKGLTEAILVDISSDKKALIQKRYAKDLRQSDFTTLEKNAESVLKNVATGMNHLHRMGLVHGDLKEDNVMINSMDDVGVSDFGLTYDPRVRLFPRTTATYEAPEMLSETHLKKSFQVDLVQRRDVYSFGIMLLNQIKKFEKLTPYLHCKANFINYNYVRELYKKCYEGQSKLLFQKTFNLR